MMLPEVQMFITTWDEIDRWGNEAMAKVRSEYRTANGAMNMRTYYVKVDEIRSQCHDKENAAWDELMKSEDKLVAFIAEHCREYVGEATNVLQALPASLDKLNEIADDSDWCDTWDEFVYSAMKDGVLPNDRIYTHPGLMSIRDTITSTVTDLRREDLNTMMRSIDAIIVQARNGWLETR